MKAQLPVRKAILLRRTYEAPAEGRAGKIRLDFNENTTGCSRRHARRSLASQPKKLQRIPNTKFLRESWRVILASIRRNCFSPTAETMRCACSSTLSSSRAPMSSSASRRFRCIATTPKLPALASRFCVTVQHGISLRGGARRAAKEAAAIFPGQSQ